MAKRSDYVTTTSSSTHYDSSNKLTGSTNSKSITYRESNYHASLSQAVLSVVLPILCLAIILSFGTYTTYAIFNVNTFVARVSLVDTDSILSTRIDRIDELDSWVLSFDNDLYWLKNVLHGLMIPVRGIYSFVVSVSNTLYTITHVVGSLFSGDYWIDNPIPEDIQPFFYNF